MAVVIGGLLTLGLFASVGAAQSNGSCPWDVSEPVQAPLEYKSQPWDKGAGYVTADQLFPETEDGRTRTINLHADVAAMDWAEVKWYFFDENFNNTAFDVSVSAIQDCYAAHGWTLSVWKFRHDRNCERTTHTATLGTTGFENNETASPQTSVTAAQAFKTYTKSGSGLYGAGECYRLAKPDHHFTLYKKGNVGTGDDKKPAFGGNRDFDAADSRQDDTGKDSTPANKVETIKSVTVFQGFVPHIGDLENSGTYRFTVAAPDASAG